MKQFNLKNKKIIFIVNPNYGKLSNINKNKIISDCFPNNPDIFFPKNANETSIISAKAFKKNQIVVNGCPRSDYSFEIRKVKPKQNNIVHFLIETDRYNMNKFQKLIGERNLNWKNLHKKTTDYLIEFAIKNPDIKSVITDKME